MTSRQIHELACPHCDWSKRHIRPEILARMLAAHVKKTHPNKENQ